MRKFLRLLLAGVLIITSPVLMAQQRTVTGTVVEDEDNKPLAGVTVTIKGSGTTAQTNDNGSFTIPASKGQVLQFTYVGHKMREVNVGDDNNFTVRMINTAAQMNEVVVTALDIKRSPRELGYSTPKIAGAEVNQTQRENLLNSLQGRVAGLTVTNTSGTPGSSSNIVLRGFNTLTGSNQPLFIIDGIIIDNSTFLQGNLPSDLPNRQNDYTNRVGDLNPNDIETYTILKGPEATALYGSQAASGAIVITTKKAKVGKLQLDYDNDFRVDHLTRFPETQKVYDIGRNGQFNSGTRMAFGPRFAPGTKTYDNVGNFFQAGRTNRHNLTANWGRKNVAFRFSGSWTTQEGFIPTTGYTRSNYTLGSTIKLFKGKIELTPSVNYINSTNDKALRGVGGYLVGLLSWPVDDDVRFWINPDGSRRKLQASGGEDDNPFFNVYKNKSRDVTDRFLYSIGVNYAINSWLSFNGRFGYDTYRTDGYTFYHPQSNYFATVAGRIETFRENLYYYNHTMMLTAKKKYGEWDLHAMVGTAWEDKEYTNYGTRGDSIKNADGNFNDVYGNTKSAKLLLSPNERGIPRRKIRRALGIFSEVGFGFRDYIYANFTIRRDELSTLPAKNRAFYYPSGSLSFIFSDAIPYLKNSKVLSFGKLRASLAGTGKDIIPYQNQSVYLPQVTSGGGYAYDFRNANPNLEPEKQLTYEIGTELRFFNDRFSVDASYYNTKNTKVILAGDLRLSYGTGFVLNTRNLLTLRNEGIEVTLNATPIKKKNFRWTTTLNITRTWNKVYNFPPNVPQFYVSDTWIGDPLFAFNARQEVFPNGNTTTIGAWSYQRNNAGQVLIDPASGLPLINQNFTKQGDRNPFVTMGWSNTLRYKNWSMSMLWDIKLGGDIFNGTELFLWASGYSKRSLDRETPRVIPGVLKDGLENTGNPTKNSIQILPYLRDDYYRLGYAASDFIEKKINWMRLRDLTFSYTVGRPVLNKLKFFKSLSAFVTFTDLILWTNYSGADPSVNGVTPGVSGVGAFGFDYGNTGTPQGYNFGFRAGF